MIGIDSRRLKLPPDAEAVDFVLVHCVRSCCPSKLDLAGVRLGAAGDEIEERGLARAVRADDRAQLAFIHVEVEVVDRLEAVNDLFTPSAARRKGFCVDSIFDLAWRFPAWRLAVAESASAALRLAQTVLRSAPGRPTMPFGMKSTTRMNKPPRMISQ